MDLDFFVGNHYLCTIGFKFTEELKTLYNLHYDKAQFNLCLHIT